MLMILMILSAVVSVAGKRLPEEYMTAPDIIRYWGYPVDTHEVLTDDGYYLTLHRIPHGRKNVTVKERKNGRPVAFLQHGLFCTSAIWILNLPRHSLGFNMADAGYDVWMGNTRGTTGSKKHMLYPSNSTEFWDFTFDEMAKYDLPAMINYVLKVTNQKQVYYVGNSQGTMMAFAELSENKDFQDKIKVMYAVGPVAKIHNIYSAIKYLVPFVPILKAINGNLKQKILEFGLSKNMLDYFADYVCPYAVDLCANAMSLLVGHDKKYINKTRLPVLLTHLSTTSLKNAYHYAQLIKSNRFQKYDYGWFGNLVMYFSFRPPIYHIEKIQTPVVLISGSEDWLASPKDVEWISEHLPNLKGNIKIKGYNHAAFVIAVNAEIEVNEKIIKSARHFA